MTNTNPPIDFSRAKEPPHSLNPDEADTADTNQNPDTDNLNEGGEKVIDSQVQLANIPGASVISAE